MNEKPGHHLSRDGSSTIYSEKYSQFYHNPNGAVAESRYNFFSVNGLADFIADKPQSLTIFEIGFGTGLNFLLLADMLLSQPARFPVTYLSVEAHPLKPEEARGLNYRSFLQYPELADLLPEFFLSFKKGWNHWRPLESKPVSLYVYNGYFNELEQFPEQPPADFIIHDPFSPEVNKELWDVTTFERLRGYASETALMSTYSAATRARAAMAKAGWLVARAPGALGKREMTLAALAPDRLGDYKRINELRLIRRLDEGEFDG